MKRFLACILLLLITGGCARRADAASVSSVLIGDASFSLADGGEPMTIADVPGIFSLESPYARIWRFAFADLDGDGETEAVLQVIDVAGDMGGYLILREEDGAVYGYKSDYRTFEDLKMDGSFGYSSPTGTEWGVCTVRFTGDGCDMVPLFCGETGDQGESVSYTVGGSPASEAEYEAAADRQRQKPDTVWYEFTGENVRSISE